MNPLTPLRRCLTRRRGQEAGYVAVLVAVLVPVVFVGCAAIAVDTSRWAVEAQRAQNAADAAALAGVVYMPADFDSAKSTAVAAALKNGYTTGGQTTVTVGPGNKPSQLRVTISRTVRNQFGAAIGVGNTTLTRTALADYSGGVAMGSPCNEFGGDPDPTSSVVKSADCSDAGAFWANVGSMQATKVSGDAFQDNKCGSGVDGCTSASGPNVDYDANGYFYTLTLTKPVTNLRIEAFDPALIAVGDLCAGNNLTGAAGTRYAKGQGTYCTGDNDYSSSTGFTDQVQTSYTLRDPGTDPSNPLTFPVHASSSECSGATTYPGYDGDLTVALNPTSPAYNTNVAGFGTGYVAKVFRQWVPICTIASAPAGTYMIQVKTNGVGNDSANGHNRFSMRAYSTTDAASKDNISISAFNKMAIYANVPNGASRFFLARVPSSAGGQMLDIDLYDIGDFASGSGTISFVAPPESGLTFSNCRGVGVKNGSIPNCQFTANSDFQGKWQTMMIPIPDSYSCYDTTATGCWVKLNYDTTNAQPTDTTSWRASIVGDPVRLIQ